MTRPTAVLTPKSRPKAATLSEARRVSGTAGAALLATSGSAIGPLSAGPRLLAQAGPAEYLAVIRRDFEQCHGAVRARDDLAARVPQGTQQRAEHGARGGAGSRRGGPVARKQGRLPHGPAPAVEPAERAGVRLRQGAHKVVDGAGGLIPHDQAVGRSAPCQDRAAVARLAPPRPLAGEQPRQDAQDQVAPVHGLGEPDERVAAGVLAPDQGPVDGRAAAVTGQERGVRADHPDPRGAEGLRREDLAPADDEHDVEREVLEQLARRRVVDVHGFVQRHAEALAQRPVIGGAAAGGGHIGPQREDGLDRDAGLDHPLQRRNALQVEPDPAESHRRYACTTSSTASITSATSWSESRGWSGRLTMRS